MPLPQAGDKQTTERLEALYDRLAEVAMVELLRKEPANLIMEHTGDIAWLSYKLATAMLNERNKK